MNNRETRNRVCWLLSAGIAAVFPLCFPALHGQEKGKALRSTEEPFTLKVPVDVVVVSARVTDSRGNPVLDLKKEDFRLFEDGQPQSLHTFGQEYFAESLPGQEKPAERLVLPSPPAPAPEGSEVRLITLFLDDLSTTVYETQYHVVEAIKKYLQTPLGLNDQVAILSASGRVLIPFTNDREALQQHAIGILAKLDRRSTRTQDCPNLTERQAEMVQRYLSPGTLRRPNSSKEADVNEYLRGGGCGFDRLLPEVQLAILDVYMCEHLETGYGAIQTAADHLSMVAQHYNLESASRRRLLLSALRQYMRSLKGFSARKSVVLFSGGFLPEPVRFELQDTIDMALRNNVILDAIDARGLFTTGVQAAEGRALPGGGQIVNRFVVDSMPAGRKEIREPYSVTQLFSRRESLPDEEKKEQNAALEQMAVETGGSLFHNNNDLAAGLRKVLEQHSHFYVMTYAAPAMKADGRYHRIKLELLRPGLQLEYRKGYYAPREEVSYERRKKEDILAALKAPGNLNEIPVRLSYKYSQLEASQYELVLQTRVALQGARFEEEAGRHKNSFSLVLAAFDESGRLVDGVEKTVELNLSESSHVLLQQRGLISEMVLHVPPGRYQIRTVVREGSQGKLGSVRKNVEIP